MGPRRVAACPGFGFSIYQGNAADAHHFKTLKCYDALPAEVLASVRFETSLLFEKDCFSHIDAGDMQWVGWWAPSSTLQELWNGRGVAFPSHLGSNSVQVGA